MKGAVCLSLLALPLSACAPDPGTGPVEVRWDRDVCERCNMAIGDRRFAAQVRSPDDHRAHLFDDTGCAFLWIDEQPWEAPAEIWVRSHDGADWLDGRTARYVPAENTPMGFGLGAVAAGEGSSLDEARDLVRKLERGRRSAPR